MVSLLVPYYKNKIQESKLLSKQKLQKRITQWVECPVIQVFQVGGVTCFVQKIVRQCFISSPQNTQCTFCSANKYPGGVRHACYATSYPDLLLGARINCQNLHYQSFPFKEVFLIYWAYF